MPAESVDKVGAKDVGAGPDETRVNPRIDFMLNDADTVQVERFDTGDKQRVRRATGEESKERSMPVNSQNPSIPNDRSEAEGRRVRQEEFIQDTLEEFLGEITLQEIPGGFRKALTRISTNDLATTISESVEFASDFVGGGYAFVENYMAMRNNSDKTLKNPDKFFHCMANCQATSRGRGGEFVASLISNAREVVDIPKNIYVKGLSSEVVSLDLKQDLTANRAGRLGAKRGLRCEDACNSSRVKGL